ncbi:MAG: glycosyltransferase [Pseudomonas profundi]|uniref:glycosyltransferase family 2 protein n=1 Tax=Pseudomonas profundi TaxID=1981513 RepID=UPI003002C1D9
MNNQSLVSVVVPCYNHAKYIQECIKSIVEQDYGDIELIVIDDGSSDGSADKIKELIAECQERFVRFEFRARPNKGLCATLNEAIEWCKGRFVSPIASDDIMLGSKISKQVSEFEVRINQENRLVAIYSGVEYIDECGDLIQARKGGRKFFGFEEVILRSEFSPTPTFMVLREELVAVGGFNSDYSLEDFYIRLRLTRGGGVFYVMGEELVKYRRHDENLSKNTDKMWDGIMQVLGEYKDDPFYRKALASSKLTHANDIQTCSKIRSLFWFFSAVGTDIGMLLTVKPYKYVFKLMLPKWCYKI